MEGCINSVIKSVRGDTMAFAIEIEDLDQDLDSAYFSCKQNYTDEDYVFQKSIGDGIEKVETGKYRIRVAPEDTATVDPGRYYFDLEIGANGDIYTLMRGILELLPDVTEVEE